MLLISKATESQCRGAKAPTLQVADPCSRECEKTLTSQKRDSEMNIHIQNDSLFTAVTPVVFLQGFNWGCEDESSREKLPVKSAPWIYMKVQRQNIKNMFIVSRENSHKHKQINTERTNVLFYFSVMTGVFEFPLQSSFISERRAQLRGGCSFYNELGILHSVWFHPIKAFWRCLTAELNTDVSLVSLGAEISILMSSC